MYESDGVDGMWMNYKENHPTTWQDVKDFFKDLAFVVVVSVSVIWVPMLCIGAADAAVKKIKETKEVRKEQKQKQQTEIKYEDALKIKNQMTQDKPKIR